VMGSARLPSCLAVRLIVPVELRKGALDAERSPYCRAGVALLCAKQYVFTRIPPRRLRGQICRLHRMVIQRTPFWMLSHLRLAAPE
jgi:hypothetical protein